MKKRRIINRSLHVTFLIIPILISGVLSYPPTLWAQSDNRENPGLTASFTKESAPIGDIVELTINYSLPEGAELISPVELKGLEKFTIIDTEVRDGKIILKLLVDTLGTLKSDEISLAYTDAEGNKAELKSDPVSLNVLSNLGEKPEDAQLRPIQDIIPVRTFWVKNWPWMAGAILLVIAALSVFYWYRKRKIRDLAGELVDPPHIKARKDLVELEAQMLFENGDVKGFYFRFSEILRQYIESLRGFPAVEYTTEEIASRIQSEEDRILIQLLRNADLAKFADFIPSNNRKEEEVKTVLSYINQTCVVFEPEHEKESVERRSQ